MGPSGRTPRSGCPQQGGLFESLRTANPRCFPQCPQAQLPSAAVTGLQVWCPPRLRSAEVGGPLAVGPQCRAFSTAQQPAPACPARGQELPLWGKASGPSAPFQTGLARVVAGKGSEGRCLVAPPPSRGGGRGSAFIQAPVTGVLVSLVPAHSHTRSLCRWNRTWSSAPLGVSGWSRLWAQQREDAAAGPPASSAGHSLKQAEGGEVPTAPRFPAIPRQWLCESTGLGSPPPTRCLEHTLLPEMVTAWPCLHLPPPGIRRQTWKGHPGHEKTPPGPSSPHSACRGTAGRCKKPTPSSSTPRRSPASCSTALSQMTPASQSPPSWPQGTTGQLGLKCKQLLLFLSKIIGQTQTNQCSIAGA